MDMDDSCIGHDQFLVSTIELRLNVSLKRWDFLEMDRMNDGMIE